MSQIPLHHSGAAASALTGLGGPSAGTRKDSGRAQPLPAGNTAAAAPSFSQLLNQSAQHLQTRPPQTQPFAANGASSTTQTPSAAPQAANAAATAQRSAQNRPANGAGNGNGARSANGTSSTAQEENKLNARNALNRNAANKQADAPKAPAAPAQAKAEAADASTQPTGARNGATDASAKSDATASSDTTEQAAADDDSGNADKTAVTDPAAAAQQMLAMLRGDAPAETRPQGKGEAQTEGATDDRGPLTGHAKGGHAAGGTSAQDALQQELQQAGLSAVDGKGQKGEAADGLQALAGGAKDIAWGDKASAGGPGQSFEALLAAAQQADGAGAAGGTEAPRAADAPSVPLSQPLDSPDFAPELSASVSLLIQDGVHEAQLQLNPADMGPVAIQIQLDGQQAQVNFHAAQADTREVLMRSMPELAAALQNQGITLSGGGVFAQTQSGNGQAGRDGDGRGDGGRGGARGGAGDDALTSTARSERRAPPRGLVDLYA